MSLTPTASVLLGSAMGIAILSLLYAIQNHLIEMETGRPDNKVSEPEHEGTVGKTYNRASER